MSDKGIIFSAPMVRALLAGTKTQTRRLIKTTTKPLAEGQIICIEGPRIGGTGYRFDPPYATSDRLYVRECIHKNPDPLCYRADMPGPDPEGPWTPSIHMPRRASRLWLAVTEVRVQRLQKISEADCIAEGVERVEDPRGDGWKSYETYPDGTPHPHAAVPNKSPVTSYRELWNSLHTEPGTTWADNPWIVAVTFTVNKGNIDA